MSDRDVQDSRKDTFFSMVCSFTPEQWAWTAFEIGSFGYSSVTLAALVPVMFKQSAAGDLDAHEITAAWGYLVTLSSLFACLASPFLGAHVDKRSQRKLFIVMLSAVSTIGMLMTAFATTWQLLFGSIVLALVGQALASSIDNSLIVFIFPSRLRSTASCVGCSLGNLGAAILMGLLLMCTWAKDTASIAHEDSDEMVGRIPRGISEGIVLAACGWLSFFTAVFYYHVSEPIKGDSAMQQLGSRHSEGGSREQGVLARICDTLSGEEMRSTRKYLVGSLLISEGAGTVYHMSTIYAVTVCNISHSTLFAATFGNRLAGSLFSVAWAFAAARCGARTCYLVVSVLMVLAMVICIKMSEEWHYWVLAAVLSMTGTGGFALGRSLLGTLTPPEKAAEVYGMNSFAGQVAGLFGPFLFSLAAHLSGLAWTGFAVAFVFLVLGLAIFLTIPAEDFNIEGSDTEERKPLRQPSDEFLKSDLTALDNSVVISAEE